MSRCSASIPYLVLRIPDDHCTQGTPSPPCDFPLTGLVSNVVGQSSGIAGHTVPARHRRSSHMTTATHPLAGQTAGPSMLGQQGTFGPGFPPPIGAEQLFGLFPQAQTPYGIPGVGAYPGVGQLSTPWQSSGLPFGSIHPQQVAAQIAPMVE